MARLDELERLAALRDRGALSAEEFTEQKQRLLRSRAAFWRAGLAALIVLLAVGGVCAFLARSSSETPPSSSASSTIPAAAAAPAPIAAEPVARPTGLPGIFLRSMLGAQVAYLERMTGPPRNISGPLRTYIVEGCSVNVREEKGEIISLGLPNLSPRCTVSLDDFGFGGPTAYKATFGMFARMPSWRMKYSADCIRSCGNAFDPNVYETVDTPHVNGFVSFRVGAAQVSTVALDAVDRWEEAMVAAEGEDWVIDNRFNCTTKYDTLAARALENVKITSFEVGRIEPPEGCE